MDKVRSSRRKEGGDKADTGKLHCIGFLFITACVKNYHCGIAELDHHEVMIFQVGLKRINNEKKNHETYEKRWSTLWKCIVGHLTFI